MFKYTGSVCAAVFDLKDMFRQTFQITHTPFHLLFCMCVFLKEQELHTSQEPEATQTPTKCAFCRIMIMFTGNPEQQTRCKPGQVCILKQTKSNWQCETLFPINTHTQNKPHQIHKHTLSPNTTLGPARI